MFAKVVILLSLLLCFDQVISQNCNPTAKTYFQCDDANEKVVTIMGKKYECPKDTICNANYLLLSTATAACDACIEPKKACDKMFTCGLDGNFLVGQSSFKCQKGFECNTNKKTSCQPCVKSPCVPNWTCIKGKESIFEIGGQEFACASNMICNTQEHPKECTPCIVKREKGLPMMRHLALFKRP